MMMRGEGLGVCYTHEGVEGRDDLCSVVVVEEASRGEERWRRLRVGRRGQS